MTLLLDPLPYEILADECEKARVHAEKVVARWKLSVDEEDPASHVWYELAIQHGHMYIVMKSLLEARKAQD